VYLGTILITKHVPHTCIKARDQLVRALIIIYQIYML